MPGGWATRQKGAEKRGRGRVNPIRLRLNPKTEIRSPKETRDPN